MKTKIWIILTLLGVLALVFLPTLVFGQASGSDISFPDAGISDGSALTPSPVVKADTGITFKDVMALVTAIVLGARLIVKLTPTPDDDAWYAKIVSFLEHVGLKLGCILFAGFLLAGCATTPQSPPTATEQKLFNITTNFVTEIAWQTNAVLVTNVVDQVPVVTTNWSVLTVTNLQPVYDFTPNTNAVQLSNTVGAITNLAVPGYGMLAALVVSLGVNIWSWFRNRRMNQAAAALAQIIEAGQQILLTLPDGQRLLDQYKAWMVKHQAETNVIGQVSALVANVVDTESARKVAEEIKRIIEADTTSAPAPK